MSREEARTEAGQELDLAVEGRFNPRLFRCDELSRLVREIGGGPFAPPTEDSRISAWEERLPLLGLRISLDSEPLASLAERAAASTGMVCVAGNPSPNTRLFGGTKHQLETLAKLLASESGDPRELGVCLLQSLERWLGPPPPLRLRGRTLVLDRPAVMGVLNVTPDSFSDGGKFLEPEAAWEQARTLVAEGADLLDIGGESTRPGSSPVSDQEELDRVLPTLEGVAKHLDVAISIDTSKATVARHAIEAGAHLVNDVTGLSGDENMASTVASTGCGLLLMHMRGKPRTMQLDPHYDDLTGEILGSLREGIEKARAAGVARESISIDPGFGFGKTVAHNLRLLAELNEFRVLGCPLAIGTSRKSTLGYLTRRAPDERMAATAATVAIAIREGAQIVRVHDVAEMRDVALVVDAIGRSVRSENPASQARRLAETPS